MEISAGNTTYLIQVPSDWTEDLSYGKKEIADSVFFLSKSPSEGRVSQIGLVYAVRAKVRDDVTVEEFGEFIANRHVESGDNVISQRLFETSSGQKEYIIIVTNSITTPVDANIMQISKHDGWMWMIECNAQRDICEDIIGLSIAVTPESTPTPTPTAPPTPTSTPNPTPTMVPTATPIPTKIRALPCRIGSQRKIEWDIGPILSGDKLTMSGRVIGDARLHDPSIAENGVKWATFVINNYIPASNRLKSMGSIWPRELASRLSGTGTPKILANKYDVTRSTFYVEARLPTSLQGDDLALAISVWGENPGSGERAIGGKCIIRN